MSDYLTGTEAYELDTAEAVLDADPSSSDVVYKETIGLSARAVAAVAAKRALAGGGGPIELNDLTDVDTAGGSEGDVLTQQANGSFALEAPSGGSQPIDVTLTDCDVDGPTVGVEFTISGGSLDDGAALALAVNAIWTSNPYTTLELVIDGGSPLMLADQVYPSNDLAAGAFPLAIIREGDTLTFFSGSPQIDGRWSGWVTTKIVSDSVDFSGDVVVQITATIDTASPTDYWHPASAYCIPDPLDGTDVAIAASSAASAIAYLLANEVVFTAKTTILPSGSAGAGAQFINGDATGVLCYMQGVLDVVALDASAPYLCLFVGLDAVCSWGVTPAGLEYFTRGVEPADGNVANGTRQQFWIPDNGDSKLGFKQKSDDGTISVGKASGMLLDGSAFLGVDKPVLSVGDAAEIMAALVTLGLVVDDT